jgi:hypothetical protein
MRIIPPTVYISSGVAPKSSTPEEGEKRDLTTDTTASSGTSLKTIDTMASSARLSYYA